MTLDFRAYAQSLDLARYPRTPHLEGSRLQDGDEGHDHVPYRTLAGAPSRRRGKTRRREHGHQLQPAGELLLQSRGHYLAGGGRERQFGFVKTWAAAHAGWLLDRLGDRYVMYGETMSKKHAVFYDALPHHFSSSTCSIAQRAASCRHPRVARCSPTGCAVGARAVRRHRAGATRGPEGHARPVAREDA